MKITVYDRKRQIFKKDVVALHVCGVVDRYLHVQCVKDCGMRFMGWLLSPYHATRIDYVMWKTANADSWSIVLDNEHANYTKYLNIGYTYTKNIGERIRSYYANRGI